MTAGGGTSIGRDLADRPRAAGREHRSVGPRPGRPATRRAVELRFRDVADGAGGHLTPVRFGSAASAVGPAPPPAGPRERRWRWRRIRVVGRGRNARCSTPRPRDRARGVHAGRGDGHGAARHLVVPRDRRQPRLSRSGIHVPLPPSGVAAPCAPPAGRVPSRPEAHPVMSISSYAGSTLPDPTVLIIDDHDLVATSLAMSLRMAGLQARQHAVRSRAGSSPPLRNSRRGSSCSTSTSVSSPTAPSSTAPR